MDSQTDAKHNASGTLLGRLALGKHSEIFEDGRSKGEILLYIMFCVELQCSVCMLKVYDMSDRVSIVVMVHWWLVRYYFSVTTQAFQ